jgi:hypothetical protein
LDHQYNDFTDLVREVSRPDSVVITNPARTNANAIRVETDVNLASQQFEVMRDAEDAVQRVAGVYNAMMGRSDKATSGTAINSLVEQGTNSVADINDNYRFARASVGERLLELLIEDMAQQESITVVIDRKKTIVLNDPTVDPASGYQYRNNDITRITLKVALSDVPSTPAYRQQQMVQIGEVLKSLPPQIQAVMVCMAARISASVFGNFMVRSPPPCNRGQGGCEPVRAPAGVIFSAANGRLVPLSSRLPAWSVSRVPGRTFRRTARRSRGRTPPRRLSGCGLLRSPGSGTPCHQA